MRAPATPGTGVLLLAVLLLSAGCGPTVDLAASLQVRDVSTGWFDAGIVNGQNKLVPSISFTLQNTSRATLVSLQVNALFRRVSETDEWGSGFVTAAGSDGLAPGGATRRLTIRSPRGYTGTNESREEMLRNSHFVDAIVELFAKYGSTQWTRVGMFPVARTLITK